MVGVLTSLCSSCVGVLALHFSSFYGPGGVFASGKGPEEMFIGVLKIVFALWNRVPAPHCTIVWWLPIGKVVCIYTIDPIHTQVTSNYTLFLFLIIKSTFKQNIAKYLYCYLSILFLVSISKPWI